MKKLRKPLIALAIVAAVLALAAYLTRPREPVYEGKRLSEWLADLDESKPDEVRANAKLTFKRMDRLILVELDRQFVNMLTSADAIWALPAYKQVIYRVIYSILGKRHKAPWRRFVQVTEAMSAIGPDAIPVLEIHLKQRQTFMHAAEALARIGPPAYPALTNHLSHANAFDRAWVLQVLAQAPSDSPELVPTGLRALNDSDAAVRVQAVWLLARIGRPTEDIHPALVGMLGDSDAYVRYNTIHALLQNQFAANGATEIVQELSLKDPETFVKNAAQIYLQQPRAPTDTHGVEK